MLYVFTGSDTAAAKAEARKRVADAGAEVVLVGEGGEPFDRALGYLGARGLFAPKVALIVDRITETAEGKEILEKHGQAMHDSDALVFLIEPDIGSREHSNILQNVRMLKGAKIEEFEREGVVAEERPNVFAFTDAFMSGDKKRSWIGYRRLIDGGISAEEIHGALMWAVRSALLATKTKSAADSGLKPFVYEKSKRAAAKLGTDKVENLSRSLVRVYHRARSGEGDMEMLTEALILSSKGV